MKTLIALAALSLLAVPCAGQTVSQLRKELQTKEAAAAGDTTALIEVAQWAKENGLINDRRRILQRVLELDADNEAARSALGYVQFDGKWVTKSKAEVLKKRALAAEMKKKGLVEVDGIWVAASEEADAKRGLFHHDGQLVTKAEKQAFQGGKVRHPRTGEFIAAEDLSKAEDGFFPVGDRWVSEAEADEKHASPSNPWVVRSAYCTLVSVMPLKHIEALGGWADGGIDTVKPLFGGDMTTPANRPIVLIATDADQYRQFGNDFGAEGSAYDVFYADQDQTYPQVGRVRPAVTSYSQDWYPYWTRHAAALAYVHGIADDHQTSLPLWFLRGVAGLAERHYNPGIASHFGRQHLGKGGVKELGTWFGNFEISGELEPAQLGYNIYQAGLVLAFAMFGKDSDTTTAVMAVTEAFENGDGKSIRAAVDDLEKVLISKEGEVREYLRALTQG